MIEKTPCLSIFEGFLFHFDKFRPLLFTILKLRGIENIHKLAPAAKAVTQTRKSLFVQLESSGGPCSRPAYAEAILDHSHPLIEHGRRRIAEVKAMHPEVRVCLEDA